MEGVTSISVNSVLGGLKKLNEVKDMLNNIENAIGSLRGGKQARTYDVDDDSVAVKEKKSGGNGQTAERQLTDRRDSVDDGQFVRQLKELVAVLHGKQDQCAAVDQPCDHDDDNTADGQTCCRGLRCSTAGYCELDCVPEGESCRHNWFCCHGRRCDRRGDDFICQ